MKSICINLDSRKDKWEAVQPEFAKLGVTPERFSAIRGTSGIRKKDGRDGCRQSHLACMEKLRPEGIFMILEDDILCCVDNAKEALEIAMEQLPEDWDALWLGANLQIPIERYSENLFSLKGAFTTHAIIWNNQNHVVDEILNYYNHENPFDVYLRDEIQENFKVFITYPMILTQKQWDSDICNRTDAGTILRNFTKYCK